MAKLFDRWRKRKEFYLDLHKDRLYCYEPQKSDLNVAVIIEGIKLGHKFPAVKVVKNGEIYEIQGIGQHFGHKFEWGGHHRAVAHYIEGVSLRCKLVGGHKLDPNYKKFIPLEEVTLEGWHVPNTLRNSLRHLPQDIAEKFCRENSLDPSVYLSQ